VSVDQKVSGPRHLNPPRRLRSPVSLVAFAVAAVPFAVHAWAALNGYFGHDDFIFTHRAAAAAPLDAAYLFQDYNGHLQPGTFLYAWLATAIAPLDFPAAMAPLLVVHAVVLWLCWRVLVRLFGNRWTVVVPFAVVASSPLILFPTLWWAYALQLLPVLLAMFAGLGSHLRYLDSGSVRHAVYAVAWVAFGLAFYVKAALVPVLLFGVTVFVTSGPTPVLTALRRHRLVWLGHLVVLGAYAGLYLSLTQPPAAANPVDSRDVLEYAYTSIVDTLLPGLFGGPFTGTGGGATWQTPHLAVRIGAAVLAVGVVVASVLRARRGALLPWLFLAAYLAADLALVASTRLGVFGPVIGTDPRYLADVVPVAVLCAVFAFRPERPQPLPAPETEPEPARRVAVAAVAVLLVVAGVTSFLRVAPALQFREAREYVATARAALAERPGMVLYDSAVPTSVILNWFVADAYTSRVVGLVPESPRFDRPAEDIYQLDWTGTPQPIINLADTTDALAGPRPDCGYLVGEQPVRIPLEDTVSGRRIVRVGYYTADSGEGVLLAGDTSVRVRFTEGLHVLHVVATGRYTHVEIGRDQRGQPICVTDVTVGVPG
jgi:hypothetical protein